jgi:hypothetical protein
MVAWTSCGAFAIARDGTVTHLPRHWPARHSGGTGRRWGADINVRRDRLGDFFLLRRGRLLWRSHARYPADGGSIAFGPGEFAFASYRRGIFITNLQGSEHLVLAGRGLYPYTFTANGDLIVTGGRTIRVLSRAGHVERRLTYRAWNGYAFDEQKEALYLVTPRGRLATLIDRRVVVARRVRSNGILSLDRGVLTFVDAHAITITTRDGRPIAHARWSGRVRADSGVAVAPSGKAFAYRLSDAYPGAHSGHATVLLLRAGGSQPHVVYRHRLGPSGCTTGAGFSWNRETILYSSADGARVLINAGTGQSIDLAAVALALPHRSPAERASFEWKADVRPRRPA